MFLSLLFLKYNIIHKFVKGEMREDSQGKGERAMGPGFFLKKNKKGLGLRGEIKRIYGRGIGSRGKGERGRGFWICFRNRRHVSNGRDLKKQPKSIAPGLLRAWPRLFCNSRPLSHSL